MQVFKPIEHPSPRVSVVIPTIPENHIQTLAGLESQTVSNYEVLIIEGDEIDICEARNIGINESNAPIIANTDDDCVPPDDWIEKVISIFQKNSRAVLVEGVHNEVPTRPRYYLGANIAYLASAASKISGFDSEFAGWYDDIDIGWRMKKEFGVQRTVFDPDLKVIHKGPTRSTQKVENERLLRKRHPYRYFTIRHPTPTLLSPLVVAATILFRLYYPLGEIFVQLIDTMFSSLGVNLSGWEY